jgi:hypothetical protein
VLWRALSLGGVDVGGVFDFDGNAAQVILAEEPDQPGLDGHEHDIVLVAAVGRRAFLGHDADYDKRDALHQNVLANRAAAVGEKGFRHRAAEHNDGGVLFHVVGVKKLSLGHRPVARRRKILAGSLH